MNKSELQALICKAADALCDLSDYVNSMPSNDEPIADLAAIRDSLLEHGFSEEFAEKIILKGMDI